MPPSRKITTFLAAATLVVAAACSAKDAPTGPRTTGPSGRLRVVNAVPDPTRGGTENVKIGDQVFAVNLAYGAATGYQRVYTGPRDLHVRRTSDTTIKVLDQTFAVDADKDFTAFALGKLTTNGGTGIAAVLLPDDNSAPTTGNVKLRFVNASPAAGSVDIYITAPTASITTLTPDVSGLNFASATAYLVKAAGTYRVRVTTTATKTVILDITQTAGTAPPSPVIPALPALTAGSIRTIAILDKSGSGTPITAAIYNP
jgi:hypothetical protein